MKKQLIHLAIGILLWLHAALSAHAVGNPPSTTFFLPLSRAGHAWEMHIQLNGGGELTSVNTFGGSSNGYYYAVNFELPAGWDIPAGWQSFWLADATDGGSRSLKNQTWLVSSPFLHAGETSTQYFTIPADRADHALAIMQPGDVFTSVTVGEQSGYTDYVDLPAHYEYQATEDLDGEGNPIWDWVWIQDDPYHQVWLPYPYRNAWVTYNPFADFQMVDFTSLEKSLANVTDTYNGGAAWEAYSGVVPLRTVTFLLPPTDTLRTFTLYGGNGGANTQWLTAYSTGVGSPSIAYGQVGVGQLCWLYRHEDGATSGQTMMPIAGVTVDLSGSFADLGANRNLQTLIFTARDTRALHEFKVVHADGYEVPVDFGFWANGYTAYSWDDNGTSNTANFCTGTAQLDVNQAWWLRDVSTGEYFGQSQQVLDGWQVVHPAAVSLSTAYVAIFEGRSAHDLRLRLPDGVEYPVSNYQGGGTVGIYDWSTANYQTLAYGWANAPYDTVQNTFTLHDATVGDESGVGGNGWADFSTWLPPVNPLTLSISPTRWGHNLYLRQAGGVSYWLTPGSIQGAWVAWNGGSSFTTYGYFDAATYFYQGLDYWIYDATDGENSIANTNTLDSWSSSLSNNDQDGDGLQDWYENIIGTSMYAWDSDGDGIADGWEVAHGLNAMDGNNSWQDTDGDGISDYQEYTLGTDPNMPAPQLTLLSPSNAYLQ